jgi:tripartite-type tricarboxylate transporter receptor subunit TctC
MFNFFDPVPLKNIVSADHPSRVTVFGGRTISDRGASAFRALPSRPPWKVALMNAKHTARRRLQDAARGVLLCALMAICGQPAVGETYPSKPVRLVVTYPPGGTSDIVSRILAQEFTARLGQSFIVDNRGGAGGQIGVDLVAKSKADGYTILVAASGPVIFLPALSQNLPYDVLRDFDLIGNIVTVPNIMITNVEAPYKTLHEFIDTARRRPGELHFGSAGVGASGHLAGELLRDLTGIDIQHVPYRGSGPAMTDLIGGQIDVMFENLPSALSQVRQGQLRGVAVLSPTRSPSAPEFPTTAELGLPDFVIDSATGLMAPKGTPPDVLALLETALRDAAMNETIRQRLQAAAADLDFKDAAQYRTYIQTGIQRWAALAKQRNIHLEQ